MTGFGDPMSRRLERLLGAAPQTRNQLVLLSIAGEQCRRILHNGETHSVAESELVQRYQSQLPRFASLLEAPHDLSEAVSGYLDGALGDLGAWVSQDEPLRDSGEAYLRLLGVEDVLACAAAWERIGLLDGELVEWLGRKAVEVVRGWLGSLTGVGDIFWKRTVELGFDPLHPELYRFEEELAQTGSAFLELTNALSPVDLRRQERMILAAHAAFDRRSWLQAIRTWVDEVVGASQRLCLGPAVMQAKSDQLIPTMEEIPAIPGFQIVRVDNLLELTCSRPCTWSVASAMLDGEALAVSLRDRRWCITLRRPEGKGLLSIVLSVEGELFSLPAIELCNE